MCAAALLAVALFGLMFGLRPRWTKGCRLHQPTRAAVNQPVAATLVGEICGARPTFTSSFFVVQECALPGREVSRSPRHFLASALFEEWRRRKRSTLRAGTKKFADMPKKRSIKKNAPMATLITKRANKTEAPMKRAFRVSSQSHRADSSPSHDKGASIKLMQAFNFECGWSFVLPPKIARLPLDKAYKDCNAPKGNDTRRLLDVTAAQCGAPLTQPLISACA